MYDLNRIHAAPRGLAAAFVVAVSLGFSAPVSAAENGEKAGTFIRALASEAIQSLANEDVSRDDRIERFRKLFNGHFATRTIGRFVLGRYWKKAWKDEQQEYLGLFEDLMVVSYVDRFAKYAGKNLNVVKIQIDKGKDTIVFTQIPRETGKPVTVLWRVREFRDVIVEGVSMSQTMRSEFASIIRANGGKVSGLIVSLREKTATLKASVK
jgi:phospholipid transport system substrate-binding protein